MEKVKVKNKKTGVIKEVNKAVASDFLGTNEWEMATDKDKKYETPEKNYVNTDNKEKNYA